MALGCVVNVCSLRVAKLLKFFVVELFAVVAPLWGERSDYAPPDEVDYFFLGNFAMGSASTHFVNYLLQQLHICYALSLAEVA